MELFDCDVNLDRRLWITFVIWTPTLCAHDSDDGAHIAADYTTHHIDNIQLCSNDIKFLDLEPQTWPAQAQNLKISFGEWRYDQRSVFTCQHVWIIDLSTDKLFSFCVCCCAKLENNSAGQHFQNNSAACIKAFGRLFCKTVPMGFAEKTNYDVKIALNLRRSIRFGQ